MTPKEKAKEIYDKMKGFRITNAHRKKCALVAVSEIQNAGCWISKECAESEGFEPETTE